MKKNLGTASIICASLAYIYQIAVTAMGSGDGLSLSTFGLWSTLAWITAYTMWKAKPELGQEKPSPAVPMIYGTGALATTIVLLIKGKTGWSMFDTLIALLTAACIVLLLVSGKRPALILSVTASAIASFPFIVMTWKHPGSSLIVTNSGFLIANVLAFVSVKEWTIEHRLYSGVNVVLCALLVIPWIMQ